MLAGHFSNAGILNIAEDLESLGRSEWNHLTNRLAVLIAHLPERQFQPNMRENSWRLTIRKQRRRAGRVLGQKPSLKDTLPAILAEARGDVLLKAEREPACRRAASPGPASCRSGK